MNIFISWSRPGSVSERVGAKLRDWIPNILDGAETWFSQEDMPSGTPSQSLINALRNADAGVFCLTRENCSDPWLLFEAGALAYEDQEKVFPFLIGVKPEELPSPLQSFFQARAADKKGTKQLLLNLNKRSKKPVTPAVFQSRFNHFWPELNRVIGRPISVPKTVSLGFRNPHLHHVNLPVTNLTRSKKFYIGKLQFQPIERAKFKFPGEWLEINQNQHLHLVLKRDATFRRTISRNGKTKRKPFDDGKPRKAGARGDCHFAIRVEDLRKTEEYLNGIGIKTYPGLSVPKGYPQFYILDPDNHIIEFNSRVLGPVSAEEFKQKLAPVIHAPN